VIRTGEVKPADASFFDCRKKGTCQAGMSRKEEDEIVDRKKFGGHRSKRHGERPGEVVFWKDIEFPLAMKKGKAPDKKKGKVSSLRTKSYE